MLDNTNQTNADILQDSISLSAPKKNEKPLSLRKTVDLVLQGKGGCGKSLIASYLAQYGEETGNPVRCYDADPVNNTLAGIDALSTEIVDLLIDETTNIPEMDRVLSEIAGSDANFLVDPGASGFVPLLSYLLREGLFDLLSESGKVVRVHTVIIGGESFIDTVDALRDMIRQLPRCVRIIVWMNPFFGDLADGDCTFEESSFWRKEAAPFCTAVRMPKMSAAEVQTFRKLTATRKTFKQANTEPAFNTVERLRLRRIWAPIREQIEATRIGL